jgi:lambda family phage minor tail protein L
MTTNIYTDLAKLQQTSPLVEMFTLDSTGLGGQVYNLTNYSAIGGGGVVFGGITYTPFPIATDGWANSSTGQPPRPKVYVSNVTGPNGPFLNAVNTLGDLVGSKFTRIRTYEKYLDNGYSPDSSQIISRDYMIVNQMDYQDNLIISWTLAQDLDSKIFLIPGRQVFRDQITKGLWAPGVSRTRVRA